MVIKLGEVLNVPISSEDIDISHKLYNGKNNPKNTIVKFISHKKETELYRKRTELKNVNISKLYTMQIVQTATQITTSNSDLGSLVSLNILV